jgi:hypothetical protein
MAVVQGIREKVHLPIYDAIFVEPKKQLREVEELDNSGTLKFFVNVQKKSKLETNLQSASLLPHYNTFEARAMRVVISDLPPKFPETEVIGEDLPVTDENGLAIDSSGKTEDETGFKPDKVVTANIEIPLDRLMDLLKKARESEDGLATLDLDDEAVSALLAAETELTDDEFGKVEDAGGAVDLSVEDIESIIDDMDQEAPPLEQIRPLDGAGNLISRIIFNTVTTLYVGEKIMIQMPTWFFPGGAGAYSEGAKFISHGEPTPLATFRFAEPIYIDKQQNFRVEIEVPDKNELTEIQKIYGPFNMWVVLDGYMVRDVQ